MTLPGISTTPPTRPTPSSKASPTRTSKCSNAPTSPTARDRRWAHPGDHVPYGAGPRSVDPRTAPRRLVRRQLPRRGARRARRAHAPYAPILHRRSGRTTAQPATPPLPAPLDRPSRRSLRRADALTLCTGCFKPMKTGTPAGLWIGCGPSPWRPSHLDDGAGRSIQMTDSGVQEGFRSLVVVSQYRWSSAGKAGCQYSTCGSRGPARTEALEVDDAVSRPRLIHPVPAFRRRHRFGAGEWGFEVHDIAMKGVRRGVPKPPGLSSNKRASPDRNRTTTTNESPRFRRPHRQRPQFQFLDGAMTVEHHVAGLDVGNDPVESRFLDSGSEICHGLGCHRR